MIDHANTRPPDADIPLLSEETAVGRSAHSSPRQEVPSRANRAGSVKLLFEPDHYTATVLLDRELSRALTHESLTQIEDCLAYVAGSTARVVVIRRATTDARNIGTEVAKLPSQAQPQENAWQRWQPLGHRVFNRLTTLPQPTIAVVNGLALGCGLDLALACDHRFAGPAVRVGPTATGLGIIPGWGGTGWLTKIIGSEHVQALIAANGQLDATTAASWGLLTSVVPADALESKAYGYAQTLAEDNEPAQR